MLTSPQKMLDRVKDQERVSYGELQTELKSLKTLLLSSRDVGSTAGPPGIFAQLGKKPSIPAWQLVQSASSSAASTPALPLATAPSIANGLGNGETDANTSTESQP